MDYYYTLQGWLKGVNMPSAGDPGEDGVGFRTGRDAFAFALGYYEGDYKPISPNAVISDSRDKLWDRYRETRDTVSAAGLYNGNISWMSTDLPGLGSNRMQAMVYGYDQLHRIVQARSLTEYAANGYQARATGPQAYDVDYSYDPNGNLLTLQRRDSQTAVLDDLTYEYNLGTNRLRNTDPAHGENYTYDEIGNLVSDAEEGIDSIAWTPYGKVRKVEKADNTSVRFRYDAAGNRIAKIASGDTTVYVREASGNVMGVYKNDTLIEQSIYGSSRLGLMTASSKTGYRTLGGKKYELSNHLGNVLALVSDNIHLNQDSTWAQVVNISDYYPFGLAMDGRTVQDSTYRYGFNGKELDSPGMGGGGNTYDYGFRIYNPGIAKFLSVDPLSKEYPELTPYQYASNTPIQAIDLDGLEAFPFHVTPFFMSPGGQIIQKATANAVYLAANRNFTEVKGKFSGSEIKALQANSTANSYSDFTKRIEGFGVSDVKHMSDLPRFGEVKSERSAAGPFDEIRYIKDPGNPDVTVDLRHFFVIGSSVPTQVGAETFGFGVEVIQHIGAQRSGYDIQDYYSNQLGAEFFNKHYDPKSKYSLSEQLNTFFQGRETEYKAKSEPKPVTETDKK